MKCRKNRKSGFTLVELLVVISIIALLMAILLPALNRAKELAKRVLCGNQMRQVGVAIPVYAEDNDGRMPWWGYSDWKDGTENKEEMHPYVAYRNEREWRYSSGKRVPMRMACLYEGKYIDEPKMFYCPSNKLEIYQYESYIKYDGHTVEWGTLPLDFNIKDSQGVSHNQWVRTGYSYYPVTAMVESYRRSDSNVNWKSEPLTCKHYAKLTQRIPIMTDILRNKDELSHKNGSTYGLHAMFGDAHVVFVDNQAIFRDAIWDEFGSRYWRDSYFSVFKLISEEVE